VIGNCLQKRKSRIAIARVHVSEILKREIKRTKANEKANCRGLQQTIVYAKQVWHFNFPKQDIAPFNAPAKCAGNR
jgi:hypothetical protein